MQQQQKALLTSCCRLWVYQKSSGALNANGGAPHVKCNTGVTHEQRNVAPFFLNCWIHVRRAVALSAADSLGGGRLH